MGALQREKVSALELKALVHSGRARLADSLSTTLALESRFDLAYNAAHALALAALRSRGYRSASRYVVFQSLVHTLGIPNSTWRVLAKAHALRNQLEYEGGADLDERLVVDLITAAQQVEAGLLGLQG